MKNCFGFSLLFVLLFICSCSTTKFVPERQYLLNKVGIETNTKDIKPNTLSPYLQQYPNSTALGVVKIQLHLYSLSGRDSSKWFNKWVRRAGRAPIIIDSTLTDRSCREIEKVLYNKGYMNSSVVASVQYKKKKATVLYHVNASKPYRLADFSYNIADKRLLALIEKDSANSAIRQDILFDRTLLDAERERITAIARNHGYYAFTNDLISYTADSTKAGRTIDLTLNVRTPKAADTLNTTTKIYRIKNVYIDLLPTKGETDSLARRDTLFYRGIHAITQGYEWIDPKVLIDGCHITPGAIYSDKMIDNTYSSFSRFPVIKYFNIRFEEQQQADSLLLNCHIQASEGKSTSITFELLGTNTAGDFGFAASAGYQFTNAFKKGVTFGFKARGAYENISGNSEGFLGSNYLELGGETSLTFPKFVFPLLSHDFKRKIRATSEASVNINYQQRPEYTRIFSGAAWTYKWSRSSMLRHSFDIINLNFVNVPYISPAFEAYLKQQSPLVWLSFESHFILGMGYRLSKTNQEVGKFKRDVYSLRASIESAGNLLYGLSMLGGKKNNDGGHSSFLGLPYSQYIRADINYARSINFSPGNSLNFHGAVGIALPYGNAESIPYEKRFYAGGANSVRGWSVRSLGPGRYKVPANNNYAYAYQLGDIRLDLSIEHRTKLFWKFESALFLDAGNIWSINEDSTIEGGQFAFREFYKQIALAYGVGLRLNFDYFIVRLDWGFKLYDPAEEGRWIKPFSGNDNTVHFAIGYPF